MTQVFDLTYFSRSQRSNFDNRYDVLQLLYYWVDLHPIFILHTSNKDTSYITRVFPLTYFSRSQTSNFEIFFTICSNTLTIGWIFTTSNKDISHYPGLFDFTYFSRSQKSNFEICTICSNTLSIGRIFTKFLSWIHLIRIHHILPRFLI
jgi:hypothetical protein